MNDPISDMIIRIKNAGGSRKETAEFPYSKIKMDICQVLEKEGYIGSISKKGKGYTKTIEVGLIYEDNSLPKIQDVKRISKLSRRVYKKSSEIRPVKNGYGRLILTTPKGILTDITARKEKIGGEVLFEIW